MSVSQAPRAPSGNRLLARLPEPQYRNLQRHLQPVALGFRQVLYEARASIDYAYFPCRCVLSTLIFMETGSTIEAAAVGSEGAVGLFGFLGADTAPLQVIVQVAGDALRIRADELQDEVGRDGPLRRLFLRYSQAFLRQVMQSVACNGLHTVQQRCCRWLLKTHDRMQDGVLPLTHELLAMMLGARRASISEVLAPLHRAGLIRIQRGKITVLDRAGLEAAACECYRTGTDEFERQMR